MKKRIAQVEKMTSRRGRSAQAGRLVSELLRGAWRASDETANAALSFSEAELTELTPLLCESGAGALAWSRIRTTALANTPSGETLHDVYRQFRLSALRHKRDIAYVLSLLRAEGIEPVLVKGWSIARRYPDPALRPYGDIDLCIRPDQFARASAALSIAGHVVDLHSGFEEVGTSRRHQTTKQKLASRVWDELLSRSQLVPLTQSKVQSPRSNVQVRVLSDEDQLRILCRHLLRSGARRPTWLCDVAVLLSPKSKVQGPKSSLRTQTLDIGHWTLDWKICLGRDSVDANWIECAVLLSHELLGVDISQTPFANKQLPGWVAPAVLREWGQNRGQSPMSNVQSLRTQRRLWTLDLGPWTSLYRRWNNPVRATAAVGGRFNNWPRFPYRVGELLCRLAETPEQLSLLLSQLRARKLRRQDAARLSAIAHSNDALAGV